MSEPTESDVLECYRLARMLFKGGAKADNKFYDPIQFRAKSTEAKHRIQSGRQLTAEDARDKFPSCTIGYGQVMRETGNTYGNCGEATAVAASYVAQRVPDVDLAVASTSPCEHAFLVVGATPVESLSVSGLGQVSKQSNVFVIDVWAGICCHASDFPTRLQTKMQEWDEAGKRIAAVWMDEQNGKRVRSVDPIAWGEAVRASSLTWKDPRGFGTAEDLQKLRDHMESARNRAMAPLQEREQEIHARQRLIDNGKQALESNPEQFLRGEEIRIEGLLADSSDANVQASLRDRQHTIVTRPQVYLEEFAEELRVLQRKLDRDRRYLDRDWKYLNMQKERGEGVMPPIAQQRAARPATTDSNPQLGSSSGRRSSPRR